MPIDLHELGHILLHTVEDTLPIIPFLYLCYLFLEFLERRVVSSVDAVTRLKGSRLGPLVGGVLGLLPQCGFSAAAAGLYAGRIVSLGTVIAVFLATSDEMLPILVANQASPLFVTVTLLFKAAFAVLCGFVCDLLLRRKEKSSDPTEPNVEELCRRDGCGCESHGIFLAAAYHMVRVFLFIFLASLGLDLLIHLIGEEQLAGLILDLPVVGHLIAAAVGLIPNCAASVVLTELYLHGALSYGALLSGLLPGAGVGLLVLFRTNKPVRENFLILLLLFVIGTVTGILLDLTGVGQIIGTLLK